MKVKMKNMHNCVRIIGVILLIAGAYYLYNRNHASQSTVKIQGKGGGADKTAQAAAFKKIDDNFNKLRFQ